MKLSLFFCLALVSLTVVAVVADEDDMKSWKRPCVVDWSGNTLNLGGIHPQQLRLLFVWSMDDSALLWYVRARPCEDYTKDSRTNTVTCSYGEILSKWEQKYPKGEHPREIRNGELVCVALSWVFPSLFGLSSDTEFLYCRKDGDKYKRVLPENGLVGGRDIADFLNKKAKVISGLR